jgi:hypothetical protein
VCVCAHVSTRVSPRKCTHSQLQLTNPSWAQSSQPNVQPLCSQGQGSLLRERGSDVLPEFSSPPSPSRGGLQNSRNGVATEQKEPGSLQVCVDQDSHFFLLPTPVDERREEKHHRPVKRLSFGSLPVMTIGLIYPPPHSPAA